MTRAARTPFALQYDAILSFNSFRSFCVPDFAPHTGNITAVFTYKWLGEQMAQIVEEGNDLYTSISEGHYSKTTPNINR